ncbi:phosphatase PAP2 family protein [Phaeobacter sp. 11ANDIMAR09]|uniref:phosphatase PAP2 family protein n=1 Tax=Phaeobacter sp. 11ANDIMAR09 TaxID=1225647 RepID=UPI0006C8E3AC|nr:phosphatase PAP2 family protein [Phaeobacter sp. 11ANDIMAR09]KPD10623.1 hypothetical protein AN476_19970 [Phaeobacter sp. 11ANDIMAR09]
MFGNFIKTRNGLVLTSLLLTVLLGRGQVDRTGDHLQLVLPVAALTCSVVNGEAASYLFRLVSVAAVVHGSKRGLQNAPINLRPSGAQHGFPSGHTAAAAFGTSSLVNSCVKKNPWVKGAIILSGGYVGASRIEVGAHFLFQVVAGALLGWLGERSHILLRALRTLALRHYRRLVRKAVFS